MLTNLLAALGPVELLIAGLVFFNLAWLAVPRWLALGVVTLSGAELALPALFSHALPQAPMYGLLANAMLAVSVWFAVRGLQHWARATVRHHEAQFWALIEHDEHEWSGATMRRMPAAVAVRRHPRR